MPISLSGRVRAPLPSLAAREWDEDQARWESQLRRLAAAPDEERAHAALPATRLDLVSEVTRRDALLLPRSLPTLSGTEGEDLVCGKCAGVVGSRITARTARRAHPEGERLIVRCPCGALNAIAGTGLAGGSDSISRTAQ